MTLRSLCTTYGDIEEANQVHTIRTTSWSWEPLQAHVMFVKSKATGLPIAQASQLVELEVIKLMAKKIKQEKVYGELQ
jgi:hypothetical protein